MQVAKAASKSKPADLVGIRAAARALNADPSNLRRQIRSGLIPNRGTPAAPLVSVAEARAAREQNVAKADSPKSVATSRPNTFAAHRTALEKLKVEKAEIELAVTKATLVERTDIEDFHASIARELRDRFIRRWRAMAVEFVGLTAREIEDKGVKADERLLSELATQFEKWAEDDAGNA